MCHDSSSKTWSAISLDLGEAIGIRYKTQHKITTDEAVFDLGGRLIVSWNFVIAFFTKTYLRHVFLFEGYFKSTLCSTVVTQQKNRRNHIALRLINQHARAYNFLPVALQVLFSV